MEQIVEALTPLGFLVLFTGVIFFPARALVKMLQEGPHEEPPKTHRTTEVSEEEKRRALKRLGIDPNDPNRRPDLW